MFCQYRHRLAITSSLKYEKVLARVLAFDLIQYNSNNILYFVVRNDFSKRYIVKVSEIISFET